MATILFVAHYLTAAIYISNAQSWSRELFSAALDYTGNVLDILSGIALLIGIIYLIFAEKSKNRD